MAIAAVEEALGTGRRKSSVARVRVRAGSGKIVINKRIRSSNITISRLTY